MTRKEAIQILSTRDRYGVPCGYTNGYQEALDMAIEALQTEVVRCKDCKHYESDGGAMMICNITDMVGDDDDYCSYGVREGGE